ncbi:MAG: stage V sporulation protein SpoVM [Acutalibacteraceae bacterium]|nr:stage V sporulation protein SpoVM [Clostridia bacterium]MEE3403203.1 stage V sporulation protein SpoVM [Acutalibacteraceae bacterium]
MKFVVIDRPKFWGFVLRRMFGIKKQPVMAEGTALVR